jgi:N-carbamoylputrescine amidase
VTRIVRGALLQATWTGDEPSMIDKHVAYVAEAAKAGTQVMCFQELFYGPYFCQVQDPRYYDLTELHPERDLAGAVHAPLGDRAAMYADLADPAAS